MEKKDQKLERLEKENAVFMAQNKDLKLENKDLEKGLREVHEMLKQEGMIGLLIQAEKCQRLLCTH